MIIVDHCSLYWATNKIAAMVGGAGSRGRRRTTGRNWKSLHPGDLLQHHHRRGAGALVAPGKWSIWKGALIHDNTTGVFIYRDLFAHDYERSPLFKGGVHGAIVNNLIYDPGQRAIHYDNPIAEEWGPHPYQVGR